MIFMPFIARKVRIPPKTDEILRRISNSRTKPLNQTQRSKIILLAAEGNSNMEIEKIVGLKQDAVSKWRNRFITEYEYFLSIEKTKKDNLEEAVIRFLRDLPRPGCPPKFTKVQILQILEIACRDLKEYGLECSHWSTPQLTKIAVEEGIVESISPSSVSCF